jgi:ornithine cyclodeaminase/alanine dehydrogenase-like protein (mu-crystallin family)
MIVIDADIIAREMAPRSLIEALRSGHRSGAIGAVERLLLQPPDGANAALTWAAWDAGRGIAVKTATVFPGNSGAGKLPNVQSIVTLFDGADGRPLATIHGESFTQVKTAADSALAADILARPDAGVLTVMGAGAQAAQHLRFHLAARPSIRRVLVWNRTPDAAERLAAGVSFPGVAISAAPDAEAAVRAADIVACLTASSEPVLKGEWLRAGSHVDLVGGFTPAMRECDDDVILRGRLFADSRRFGVTTCGDYGIPIATGLITPDAIEGDLFDLCSGRVAGRRSADDISVCKNGGGGHLDLMAARAFYDATTAARPA